MSINNARSTTCNNANQLSNNGQAEETAGPPTPQDPVTSEPGLPGPQELLPVPTEPTITPEVFIAHNGLGCFEEQIRKLVFEMVDHNVATSLATVTICTPVANGVRVRVTYEVMEVKELEPLVVWDVGEGQTRQRDGNLGSTEQIILIATRPDLVHLGESLCSSIGAPVVEDVVVAGNGRSLGIILGYKQSNGRYTAYREMVLETAKRLGIVGAANLIHPVLIRRVCGEYQNGTKEEFVVQSNEQGILGETVSERARLDAVVLGDLSSLEWTPAGKLYKDSAWKAGKVLGEANRNPQRDTEGNFDVTEVTRRVQLAGLAKMAQDSEMEFQDLNDLIESDTGRKILNEIMRWSGRLNALQGDLNISKHILQALQIVREGIHYVFCGHFGDLREWYDNGCGGLFKNNISREAKGFIRIMAAEQSPDRKQKKDAKEGKSRKTVKGPSPYRAHTSAEALLPDKGELPKLRDVLRDYANKAEAEQAQRKAEIEIGNLLGDRRTDCPGTEFLKQTMGNAFVADDTPAEAFPKADETKQVGQVHVPTAPVPLERQAGEVQSRGAYLEDLNAKVVRRLAEEDAQGSVSAHQGLDKERGNAFPRRKSSGARLPQLGSANGAGNGSVVVLPANSNSGSVAGSAFTHPLTLCLAQMWGQQSAQQLERGKDRDSSKPDDAIGRALAAAEKALPEGPKARDSKVRALLKHEDKLLPFRAAGFSHREIAKLMNKAKIKLKDGSTLHISRGSVGRAFRTIDAGKNRRKSNRAKRQTKGKTRKSIKAKPTAAVGRARHNWGHSGTIQRYPGHGVRRSAAHRRAQKAMLTAGN